MRRPAEAGPRARKTHDSAAPIEPHWHGRRKEPYTAVSIAIEPSKNRERFRRVLEDHPSVQGRLKARTSRTTAQPVTPTGTLGRTRVLLGPSLQVTQALAMPSPRRLCCGATCAR